MLQFGREWLDEFVAMFRALVGFVDTAWWHVLRAVAGYSEVNGVPDVICLDSVPGYGPQEYGAQQGRGSKPWSGSHPGGHYARG